MDKLLELMAEIDIPSAYDHFAEGESPDPPFITYLLPGSDNFAADGKVYFRENSIMVRPDLNATAKELLGIDNFTDMIADETVTTDCEELLNWLTEKEHPVLAMEPLM